jgi:molecular chaperone GrpE
MGQQNDETAEPPDEESASANGTGTTATTEDTIGQAEEYRALLQRERADFINYRRRVEAERGAQIGQARADALIPILPLLDDLERATGEVPADLRDQPWVKGVLLITGKLDSAMRAAGLERIDALGQPFDPYLHEAFLHQVHPSIPAGHVSLVMRPGYRMGDRVLRAAQVAVSQGAEDGEGSADES